MVYKIKYNVILNNLYNNKCVDFCEVDFCMLLNVISKLMICYIFKEIKFVEINVEYYIL